MSSTLQQFLKLINSFTGDCAGFLLVLLFEVNHLNTFHLASVSMLPTLGQILNLPMNSTPLLPMNSTYFAISPNGIHMITQ